MKRSYLLDDIIDMFERSAIGFNRIVPSAVSGASVTYPPFNVVKEKDGRIKVEMALAGFSRDEVQVTKGNNFLTVEGSKVEEEKDYIWQGIAARKFKREIPIANGVEVISAEMKDGILNVVLENTEVSTKQIPIL